MNLAFQTWFKLVKGGSATGPELFAHLAMLIALAFSGTNSFKVLSTPLGSLVLQAKSAPNLAKTLLNVLSLNFLANVSPHDSFSNHSMFINLAILLTTL